MSDIRAKKRLLSCDIGGSYSLILNKSNIILHTKYLAIAGYESGCNAWVLYFTKIFVEYNELKGVDNDGEHIQIGDSMWKFYKIPSDTPICRIIDPEKLNLGAEIKK